MLFPRSEPGLLPFTANAGSALIGLNVGSGDIVGEGDIVGGYSYTLVPLQ